MGEIHERIVLTLDGAGVKATSLSGLIEQLQQVEAHVQKVNAALNGMKLGPGAARSVREFETQIKTLQTRLGTSLKTADLSKALGVDQVAFDQFLARQKNNLKNYQATLDQFRSANAAARAFSRFEREQVGARRVSLAELVRPTAGPAQPTAAAATVGAAKVEGTIALLIPASQIQASVVGPVPVAVHGGAGGAGGAGGGAGGAGGKPSFTPTPAPGNVRELQRVTTETKKYIRDTVAAVDETGSLITSVHDKVEGLIKTSKRTTTGQPPLAQFREARRLAEENFKQLKSAIDPNDPGYGLAALLKKQADQLRALTQQPFMKQLGGPQQKSIANLLGAQAQTFESRGIEAFKAAQTGQSAAFWRQHFKTSLTPGGTEFGSGVKWSPNMLIQGPPAIPSPGAPAGAPATKVTRALTSTRGFAGFTPAGFASNLVNVAGWMAAVTALFKAFELAGYSLKRFNEIGQQTARLAQVFRGIGGSARELTGDMLKLAAATGRDSQEAMESATEWSRLGLTRTEVNEAVRVSLVAANVAQLHTAETTKQLASLFHIYNLQVGDLDGVLGMLTATSQKYNVTLEDLFTGLDRSAGSAKLAGVSLSELQAMIGTVVGKTGQSGIIVGNTIKSLLVQFSNPDIQKFLRGFGIETLTNEGGQKTGSQIVREMAMRWQSLDPRQQQSLTQRLVGRLSAARFVPLMDDYLRMQKLAIDGQLNLNAAQDTNAKILGTIKAQLAGVRAEWDRLVVKQMNSPLGLGGPSLGDFLGGGIRITKNVMRLFNGAGGSVFDMAPGPSPILTRGIKFGMDKFNQAMETPFERGTQSFQNAIQLHGAAAAANVGRVQMFDFLSNILGKAKPEDVEIGASEMSPANATAFRAAMRGGNLGEARKVLDTAKEEARKQGVVEAEARTKAFQDRYAAGKAELAGLNKTMAEKQAAGKPFDKEKQAAEDLSRALHELSAARDEDWRRAKEIDGDMETVFNMKQQYINLLKEEQDVMSAIDQLSQQSGMETAGAKLDTRIQALSIEKQMLEADVARLTTQGAEGQQPWMEAMERLKNVSGELASAESPQMRALAGMMDRRQIAARRAQQESASYAVGLTEADRLLEQERRLKQERDKLVAAPFKNPENDLVRLKQIEIELFQTQEKIQARIIDLARQEKQIRLEANREFQKNLLLAGPGEQLQRLYVQGLSQRGVSSGEFNALSPDAKRLYFDLLGGEAGALSRQERARLRGRGMTVEQEQALAERTRQRLPQFGGVTAAELRPLPPMPLPFEAQARASADALSSVTTSAKSAAAALAQLPSIVDELVSKTLNAVKTNAPKLGINPGFALGARHN